MAKHHGISKIISGGQAGADRAGIDAAIDLGIDYGGSIPKGRRTEDGTLPEKYDKIAELASSDYSVRTEKNVLDADATVIFTYDRMGSGSALTVRMAEKHHKPYLHINLKKTSDDAAVKEVSDWLENTRPRVLNVAGSRESGAEGIYDRVFDVLKDVLSG